MHIMIVTYILYVGRWLNNNFIQCVVSISIKVIIRKKLKPISIIRNIKFIQILKMYNLLIFKEKPNKLKNFLFLI